VPVLNNNKHVSLSDAIPGELLLHPVLSRLQDVNLLGAFGFLLHKPNLSRFDHSLGCADLAMRITRSSNIRGEDASVLVLAALLHDIGHSPFSHSTEVSMYQMYKRYHRGQTCLLLTNYKSYLSNYHSIQEIIETNLSPGTLIFDKLLNTVRNINAASNSLNGIYQILSGPINIDTLDAIGRSAIALDVPHVKPYSIIDSISFINNMGYVIDNKALALIKRFWHTKEEIYQNFIFTAKSQAFEAMVNRAISLAYNGKNRAKPFFMLTDSELIDILMSRKESRYFWDLISQEQPFLPLWNNF
jgi:HD superfamily phosphohydrolase